MLRPKLPEAPTLPGTDAHLITSAPAPRPTHSAPTPAVSQSVASHVGLGAGAVAAVVVTGVVLTALLATVAITAVAVSIAALVLRSLLNGAHRR